MVDAPLKPARPENAVAGQHGAGKGQGQPALSRKGATPSLRATGSRERAPDDRLREAIQDRKQDWIASSQEFLAMTEERLIVRPS
jgi:hypothetical protein